MSDDSLAFGPIDAGPRMGHVHLKVANLERALGFYCGVLGFQLMQRMGNQAAFVGECGAEGGMTKFLNFPN